MKKHELSIGLNDQTTLTQLISTQDAINAIIDYCRTYNKAFTLTTATGGYLMDNGQFTVENTIRIEFLQFTDIDIELNTFIYNFIQYFLIEFNQESIAHAVYNTESDLIYLENNTVRIIRTLHQKERRIKT